MGEIWGLSNKIKEIWAEEEKIKEVWDGNNKVWSFGGNFYFASVTIDGERSLRVCENMSELLLPKSDRTSCFPSLEISLVSANQNYLAVEFITSNYQTSYTYYTEDGESWMSFSTSKTQGCYFFRGYNSYYDAFVYDDGRNGSKGIKTKDFVTFELISNYNGGNVIHHNIFYRVQITHSNGYQYIDLLKSTDFGANWITERIDYYNENNYLGINCELVIADDELFVSRTLQTINYGIISYLNHIDKTTGQRDELFYDITDDSISYNIGVCGGVINYSHSHYNWTDNATYSSVKLAYYDPSTKNVIVGRSITGRFSRYFARNYETGKVYYSQIGYRSGATILNESDFTFNPSTTNEVLIIYNGTVSDSPLIDKIVYKPETE